MRIEMIKDTSDIYTTMIQAQLRLVADNISKAAHEGKDRVVLDNVRIADAITSRLEERFHYRVVRTESNDKTTPRTIIFFERGKDNNEEIEKLGESFWNKVSFPKKLLQELPETYI